MESVVGKRKVLSMERNKLVAQYVGYLGIHSGLNVGIFCGGPFENETFFEAIELHAVSSNAFEKRRLFERPTHKKMRF